MGCEIERKFLADKTKWLPSGKKEEIRQGYLSTDPERVVRVRISGGKAYLCIKGKQQGISRDEFEYEIPYGDAVELMKLVVSAPVEKSRYTFEFEGHIWEVDIFSGLNEGLALAEVELDSENEPVTLPPWIISEVSGDERYMNVCLSVKPFSTWEQQV